MINNAEFGIYRVGICYSEARCHTSQIQVFTGISDDRPVARSAGRAGFLIEIKECAVENVVSSVAMKDKPASGRLMLVCMETGKEIDCGVKYTQDDLDYAKPAKLLLQCGYCGKTHIFKFSDARLKPIGLSTGL